MSYADGLQTGDHPNAFLLPFVLPELVSVRAMAGDETWTERYRQVQCVDPTGVGRAITLPALRAGLWFLIANKADAAETLTIKELAGGTTVETCDQNESLLLWCNGTVWAVVTIFTATIT